mgnify:CR=1 FL=1
MSKFNLNENDLSFTVTSVDKIAKQFLGAEEEFKKGDEYTYDELIERIKDASETINGIVVYTTSANSGNHVGEPRYLAYVENIDLKTNVEFCTPDPNETAKMASTLKFK